MSAKYYCDIEECQEEAYSLTFEAKKTLIRLHPHLVIGGVVEPEHLCLGCMEELTHASTPLFYDGDEWIDIECCNNCKYHSPSYTIGVDGKCTLEENEGFSVTDNYSCMGYVSDRGEGF